MAKKSKEETAVPDPDELKKKRIMGLLVGGGLFLFLIIIMVSFVKDDSKYQGIVEKRNDVVDSKSFVTPAREISEKETWIVSGERKLKELEQENETLRNTMESYKNEFEKKLRELEKKKELPRQSASIAGGREKFPELPISPKSGSVAPVNSPAGLSQPGKPGVARPVMEGSKKANEGREIQEVSLMVVDMPVPAGQLEENKKKEDFKTVDSFIPSGAFMKAVILGGIDAPAGKRGKKNPHPVLMRITDNSFLPNRYRKKTRECVVVAAGYGDLSSERALVRTERISCVMKNRKLVDVPIKGTVYGEDGKNGIRGRLVSKQGQMIANAFLAGLGSGFGNTVSKSVGTYSVNPLGATQTLDMKQAFQSGAAGGIGNAMQRIADFYMDLAEQTFPVVEIPAGRFVTVVVTRGSDLTTRE